MSGNKVQIIIEALNRSEKAFAEVDSEIKRISASARKMADAMKFAGLALGGFITAKISGDFLEVNKRFGALNASLVTVTGSQVAANRAFEDLQKFAAETPYQLDDVVHAFIKMKALGIDASEEALKSYGNTASAMGKSLDQMIEAVADAATGEFERLKEFGIKARQTGDQVTLTFRGVATTIGNNAQDIEGYLRRIGEVEFAGGMARQMDTLAGKSSNLSDAWDALMKTIGDVGGTAIASGSIEMLTESVTHFSNAIKLLNEAMRGNVGFLDWASANPKEAEKMLRGLEKQGSETVRRIKDNIERAQADIRSLEKTKAEIGEREDIFGNQIWGPNSELKLVAARAALKKIQAEMTAQKKADVDPKPTGKDTDPAPVKDHTDTTVKTVARAARANLETEIKGLESAIDVSGIELNLGISGLRLTDDPFKIVTEGLRLYDAALQDAAASHMTMAEQREADLNSALAEIDMLKQGGEASRGDAAQAQLRIYEELIKLQTEALANLDKLDDPAGWYAQSRAIQDTRRTLLDLREELERVNGGFSAGASKGMREWLDATSTSFETGREIAGQSADAMQSSFADLFGDGIRGELDSFSDYFKGFTARLTNIWADALAEMATTQIIQSFAGDTGTNLSGLGSLLGGLFGSASGSNAGGSGGYTASVDDLGGAYSLGYHGGGVLGVDPPAFVRLMPSAAFLGAPRYHDGLASDEVAAILQRGESVFTKGQTKALGAALGKGGTTITIPVSVSGGADSEKLAASLAGEIRKTVQRELRRAS